MSEIDDFGDQQENLITQSPPRTEATNTIGGKCAASGMSQWQVLPDNKFIASSTTTKQLPSGYYTMYFDGNGYLIYTKSDLETDDLIILPGSNFHQIIEDIKYFWAEKAVSKFIEYSFLHRRGYMFYGPAGGGKTSLVQLILKHFITESEGIVFNGNCNPGTIAVALRNLRLIEPTRPLICLFEDIDAIISRYGDEELLALLDGENNSNHVLNIATTNYPEKLDKRIVGRPRRFDQIIKIGYPEKKARKLYFKKKLNINGDDLKKFVDATEDFTFAALAELVIAVKCFDKPFDEVIERLRDLMKKTHHSDEFYSKSIGIK